MVDTKRITVEVAYALPDRQLIIPLKVEQGTTVFQAAELSGIADQFEEVSLETDKMGIFGKTVKEPMTEVLKPGDRVEIYRPLIIDPKAARAKRAEKAKLAKAEAAEK